MRPEQERRPTVREAHDPEGARPRMGRVMRALLVFLLAGMNAARASTPDWMPGSVKAWLARQALARQDLDGARRWKPTGALPAHRLLAAQIALWEGQPQAALTTLAPLTGQGAPRPLPAWRIPALLLAAEAQMKAQQRAEAQALLERALLEDPGRPEAVHNLQTLLRDPLPPPPPNPKKPPPPPPRPSQGARQDELEGIRQRMPQKPKAQGGVKDV